MPLQTPCVGICRIHPEYRICIGCYRSRLEIVQWTKGSDTEKAIILTSIEQKKLIYGELDGQCS